MVKGVLFDMDGLMFDTERLGQAGWQQAGKELGFPITEAFVSRIRGRNETDGKAVAAEIFGPSFDFPKARAIRFAYVDRVVRTEGMPLKPGLLRLLDTLKQRGIPTALATSTRRSTAFDYLKIAGVEDFFSAAVCGDVVVHSKPEPEIFLKAAEKLGAEPSACIVLEDSPSGVEAGFRAGCMTVMVPDLTPPDDRLRTMYRACVKTLEEVIPFLDIW